MSRSASDPAESTTKSDASVGLSSEALIAMALATKGFMFADLGHDERTIAASDEVIKRFDGLSDPVSVETVGRSPGLW